MIAIHLNQYRSNTYGGWGTYWIVVATGSGDSGGFCFEGVLSNSATGSGPSCTATLAVPSGGIGPIQTPGVQSAPSFGSTSGLLDGVDSGGSLAAVVQIPVVRSS